MILSISLVTLLFLLILLTAVLVDSLFLRKHARNTRSNLLRNREVEPFEQWFAYYYGNTNYSREQAERIIEIFAKWIEVEPTQLKPTDQLAGELALPWWDLLGSLSDYGWHEDIIDYACDICGAGIRGSFKWGYGWKTLDDVIRGTLDQIASYQRHSRRGTV